MADISQDNAESSDAPIVIKKYANRRLYNTATSAYVTLEHLSEMVRDNVDFVVQDAKTGEDITRSVLAQIIFDQENKGQSVLPVSFLRRLIRFYGDSMQGFLPAYLDLSMETFAKSQDQMRDQVSKAFGGRLPLGVFEETAKQNMALFQQAMRMWAPFAIPPVAKSDEAAEAPAPSEDNLNDLKRQMELMQKQLDQLTKGRKP
ncbi:MAG: polyhydroxyalkanoate synthesis repressor PhaR [Caulobacterales bacterium]